jgi:hypothetical protein
VGRGKAGKLKWAGRALITGTLFDPDPEDEVSRDCAAFGIAPPALPVTQAGLWACHLAPLNAFLAVGDQWRVASTAKGLRFMGLDYTAAQAGLALAGISLGPDDWADLRVIERAAKAALNGD